MAIETLGDKVRVRGRNRNRNQNRFSQLPRGGRDGHLLPTGGIDFSGCVTDPDTGFCCVEVEETVQTVKRDPLLECTHRNEEKCHYTYVTQFTPTAEEVCEENFEKICQITFKQEAKEEQVEKCYRPLVKNCDGKGEEVCQTLFESSCTTRYIEKQPGKFVGDTKCEKQPVDICGAGCVVEEGPEECFDKTVLSLLDIPEEICDLNPQKTCKFQTRLVPKLKPEHECTIIPRETCFLKFTNPEQVDAPLKTKWCQDPSPPTPGETYEETAAVPPPVYSRDGRTGGASPPPPSPPAAPSSQGFGPQQFRNQNDLNQDNQIQIVELNQRQSGIRNNQFTTAQDNVLQSGNQIPFRQQNVNQNNQFSIAQDNQIPFNQLNGNQNNQFSTVQDNLQQLVQDNLQQSSNQIAFSQQNGRGFNQFINQNGINSNGQVSTPIRGNVGTSGRGGRLNSRGQRVFGGKGIKRQRSSRRQSRMASHDDAEVIDIMPAFEKMKAPKAKGETGWELI